MKQAQIGEMLETYMELLYLAAKTRWPNLTKAEFVEAAGDIDGDSGPEGLILPEIGDRVWTNLAALKA